jgi:putative sigma-54 modulation protein
MGVWTMQIAVKGRGITVTDEQRERIVKRFAKVDKQVSDLARLEVELSHERNPSIPECEVAEATLQLKGVTLRARERARDAQSAVNLCAEDLARQVKRHRDKRRRRREARAASLRPAL